MKFQLSLFSLSLIFFAASIAFMRPGYTVASVTSHSHGNTDSLFITESYTNIDSSCVAATIDSLLNFAHMYLGIPYRYGGKSEKGFDCSGFTSFVYKHFGFYLPPTSDGQAFYGDTIGKNDLSRGDLVFFKGRNSKSTRIGHVGIVTEVKDDDVLFIHSSSNKGIMITSTNSAYYLHRYVTARRLIK